MLPLETFLDARCPRDYQVDSVTAGTRASICISLKTADGCPVDLTNQPASQGCPTDTDTSSSSAAATPVEEAGLPDGWTLYYRAKEMYHTQLLFKSPMVPLDPENGVVRLDVAADDLQRPGMYVAEVVLLDADGNRAYSEARYLEVKPALDDLTHATCEGPLTVSEVRLALRDYGCDNTLLDAEEFTNDEIAYCMMRPVRRWNETPPSVRTYTAATFPFREHWTIGVIGYLHRIAASHYRRNHLDYAGTGLNVSDKRKYDDYERIGAMRIQEYDAWMAEKKTEINVSLGFGTYGSPYGNRW